MNEAPPEFRPHSPLLKELGISHIGTLVLLGQGPIQDSTTKVKLATVYKDLPNYEGAEAEGNTWLRMIARAGAALWKTGGVDTITASGGARGNEFSAGEKVIPSEYDIMKTIIENLTRAGGPPVVEGDLARNTMWNMINAANQIDAKHGSSEDAWFVCAHFQMPRVKLLANILGFNPNHVVSAEGIIAASSRIALRFPRGEDFKPELFDRQVSTLQLLQIRLSADRTYFDRKKSRAFANLQKLGVQNPEKLYVEEQQTAADRMELERRWVRGIAMESQYIAPLLKELHDPARRERALSYFPTGAGDQEWSWQVVKEEWRNAPYPYKVRVRLQHLGLSREDIDSLTWAHVPKITLVGASS